MRGIRFTDKSLYIVFCRVKEDLFALLETINPAIRLAYIAALYGFLKSYLYYADADTKTIICALAENPFENYFDKETIGNLMMQNKTAAQTNRPNKLEVDKGGF